MKAVLKKAAVTASTLADGGLLNRAQFNTFVNLLTNYSQFMKIIRIVTTDKYKGQIDKLDFGTPVTRAATEATAYTDTRQPDLTKVNYDCVKMVGAYDISSEAEEDNIEGGSFTSTLMNAFSQRMALDMADLCVNGDTSIVSTTAVNLLRASNEGLHKLTTTAPNILDANGLGISLAMFRDGLKQMPERYRGQLKRNLRWLIGSDPYVSLQHVYGDRETTGGDSVYKEDVSLKPFGIPLIECPVIPTDLTIGTAGSDGTFMILTDPKNLVYFLRRKMKLYSKFQERSDLTEVTAYYRSDFVIENENNLVKVRSISNTATTAYSN